MICQQCQKAAATVHITEVGDGESHLCETCAHASGVIRPEPVHDWCQTVESSQLSRRIRDILRRDRYFP